MEKIWKSPRKIEEEVRDYRHKRFETYMKLEDDGILPRALAISALRDEIEYETSLTTTETADV